MSTLTEDIARTLKRDVLSEIEKNPGIDCSKIAEKLSIQDILAYRVAYDLQKQGLIEIVLFGNKAKLYEKSAAPKRLSSVQEKILAALSKSPSGVYWKEIKSLDYSNPYDNLRAMLRMGLVKKEKKGKRVLYFATAKEADIKTALEIDRGLSDEEIKIIRARSVSPQEIGKEIGEVAGGRVECLIRSILIKCEAKSLEEVREHL